MFAYTASGYLITPIAALVGLLPLIDKFGHLSPWCSFGRGVLFALLVWRGFIIAMRAKDRFGSMLAMGLTMQVGIQTLLNIAVVTNTVPNTGISLPFFSYGGTALLMQLAEMGVLLNISRQAKLN